MRNGFLLTLLLVLNPVRTSTAQYQTPSTFPPQVTLPELGCPMQFRAPFDSSASTSACAWDSAAAALTFAPRLLHVEPAAPRTASGARKGAQIGLGVGFVAGVVAAIILAPKCEENAGTCRVILIGASPLIGAGIGAAIGALVSQKGDS
jgi:hypothetical protein